MITVTRAPPYLTVQDTGRRHALSAGVPRGGAMDAFAAQALNALVGNPGGSATLEWALGGGIVIFRTGCAFAIGGASARATLAGKSIPAFTTVVAKQGDELAIERLTSGRFLYIALSGGIDVPRILGSRSTYLPGRFGGHHGRMIGRDDSLRLGTRPPATPPEGFACPRDILPDYGSDVVRVTRGTHSDLFDEPAWDALTTTGFSISPASDRTGYRLSGTPVTDSIGNLPSDPGCQGAVQIPGDGAPIVLMADAPTVGGYPKMAVVCEADLPILAQRTPGERVRFALISIEESQRALKQRALDLLAIRSGAASA